MNFGQALEALYPDNHKHNPGAKVPWTANQMEQFAEDWYILE